MVYTTIKITVLRKKRYWYWCEFWSSCWHYSYSDARAIFVSTFDEKRWQKVVSAHIVLDSFIGSIKGAKILEAWAEHWLNSFTKGWFGFGFMVWSLMGDKWYARTKDESSYDTINMSGYKHSAAEKKSAPEEAWLEGWWFCGYGEMVKSAAKTVWIF